MWLIINLDTKQYKFSNFCLEYFYMPSNVSCTDNTNGYPDLRNFYIGLSLALISCFFMGFSYIVKKLSLNRLMSHGKRAGISYLIINIETLLWRRWWLWIFKRLDVVVRINLNGSRWNNKLHCLWIRSSISHHSSWGLKCFIYCNFKLKNIKRTLELSWQNWMLGLFVWFHYHSSPCSKGTNCKFRNWIDNQDYQYR